jgi:small ubiquitin-related modifier
MSQSPSEFKPKALRIKVVDTSGKETEVKIRPDTPLRKLFHALTRERSVQPGTFRFTFDGKRLSDEDTPENAGICDGDVIDCHLAQQGGGLPAFRYFLPISVTLF